MLKLEAEHNYRKMPWMLAKSFRIEVRVGGNWQTVYEDKENIQRLRRISFPEVKADAIRLTVLSVWGTKNAHVFAFDVL